MSKRGQSSRGQGSEHVGALLALQGSGEHPEVRSINTGDARVIFRPTAASSWVCSGSSKVPDLFLARPAGTTRRDGEPTPAAGDALPRCVSTRRSERQRLLEGAWRGTKSSARLFAIPLLLFGYRFCSSRTFSRTLAVLAPGSSRSAASQ